MSDEAEKVGGFLARNKLTGVAISMLLELVFLIGAGSWWFSGLAANLHNADALMRKDIEQLEQRTSENESDTNRVEDKVLKEIKEMRIEFKTSLERIEDRMDRRGSQ